jgi:Zn-dependent protease with chaperone function
MAHHLITSVAAVLPAVLAFWWGRRLEQTTDDAALFDQRTANRTRNSFAFAACVTLICISGGSNWIWGLPLLVVTRLSVGYKLRKRLFNETWSIFGYASFFTRLCIAAFGFWILLGFSPWLVSLTGSRGWAAAAVMATVMIAFNEGYGCVFRKILRARRVDDPTITSRFDLMVSACALRNVALEQVDMRGGGLVNAVALPSTQWPAVVMTNTLMERLDPDETAAILAHELAHLEHYTPARLKTLNRVNYALIISGTSLTPIAQMLFPQVLSALMWVWQLVLLTTMVVRAKDRQANETASDMRAIALSGNPDALARALVKIHAAGRIARRWDVEWERHATHPSLARRIQAIHAAAGIAPAKLGESAVFASTDGSSVTFHGDRLVWSEHGEATHSLPYGALAMVRVDATSPKTPRLVAIDTRNRRWELPLNRDDMSRAQAVLDIVDGHLGAASAPPPVSLMLPRVIALTAVIVALSVQPWTAALIAALAAAVPALPIVGAAAGASIGAAAIALRTQANWITDWEPWMAFALLAAGVLLLVVNIANRRETIPKRATRMMLAIGIVAIVSWIPICFSTGSVVDLHFAFLQRPSLTVFAFALGVGLAFMPRPLARYASAAVTAAAVAALMAGSTAFLDRFAHDPFVARAQPLQVRHITGDPIAKFDVDFTVDRMLLSPAGRFVAIADDDDDDEITTFHAGAAGGPLTTIEADDALFVTEGRLLVLDHDRTGSIVRLVDLAQSARSVWSHHLDLSGTRLSFDQASNSWRVVGWSDDDEDLVSVAGMLGSDSTSETRWKAPMRRDSYIQALAVSDRHLLALETTYARPIVSQTALPMLASWMPPRRASYRLWSLGPDAIPFGESHLVVNCPAGSSDREPPVCTAYDGSRTGFFTIDAALRQTMALATVERRSYVYSDAGYGWMAGWWDGSPVLIRAAKGEAIRVASRAGDRPYALGVGQTAVGAVTAAEHGATIQLYSLSHAR